jgi:D-sedoheptulose 7-phosphate isomerase
MSWLTDYKAEQKRVLDSISDIPFEAFLNIILDALKQNKKIFVIGNGGSAANASHFVEDLGKGAGDAVADGHFAKATGVSLPRFRVIDLTSSAPYITALGNDYCFEDIYVRQLKTLADPGDVLIGISVSGTSTNIVRAFEWGEKNGLTLCAMTGKQAKNRPDSIYAQAGLAIAFDSEHFGIVEDCQMSLLHMICYYIMERLK